MKTAIELIADERKRQIEVEGYTPEHDDEHVNGELAKAAAVYSMPERKRYGWVSAFWPWDLRFWKPTPENRIRELVKSASLVVAEIERLQRIKKQKP